MNQNTSADAVRQYTQAITQQFYSGHAREHAYRPALERLMSSYQDVRAVNDPARSENGNPDFVFLKASNKDIILGYAEAKDITVNVDKTLKTEQLRRYAGYEKLFLTNYLDFVFLRNGQEYQRISIGNIANNAVVLDQTQFARLAGELQAFLDLPPEQIKSGKKLSVIMGGKARRIRDNVRQYLHHEGQANNAELEKIYQLMQQTLVHDLTYESFADMYAQTLVYGLFAARYNDTTPDDFSRREAVETVPKSNPFLRKFFDHIAGADFDPRLSHIVDELCDVFRVSDVNALVHKHLRLFELGDEKDPIIHFYEDFLKEYDPAERKKMGAYYTPMPVVQYIVRHVDRILKEDFGITKGLADTGKISYQIDHGQRLQIRDPKTGKLKTTTKEQKQLHRVQVLDPAVGTATFLNETIKHIRQSFDGQEGLWPAYVNDHLLPRLHGFELMMAPYTVAHLKLGITLQETGVKDISQRLGVYLTNTLEEGIPRQQDLFSFGLAGAVTEESQQASQIKHERPIMVVMGNPPYSVNSNNKSVYIQNLIKDYKKDLNERKINLDDDYIKFIRFAEDMIAKNGEGIVAMITNNSYIDGITHRQMRKHLLQTFDKIYVLDLHGNSKKREVAPDGSKDENVFDIQQGVAILLAVKTGKKQTDLAEVYHADLFGTRKVKFAALMEGSAKLSKFDTVAPNYFFVPKDIRHVKTYERGIALNQLFIRASSGIQTNRDRVVTDSDRDTLIDRIRDIANLSISDETIRKEIGLKDTREKSVTEMRALLQGINVSDFVKKVSYRIFDDKWIFFSDILVLWTRMSEMKNYLSGENIGLVVCRQTKTDWHHIFITNKIVESSYISNQTSEYGYSMPLFIYHEDGSKNPNFDPAVLKDLLSEMGSYTYTAERSDLSEHPDNFWVIAQNVFDYIYGVLHTPSYRQKYKEFLKTDFPRVPKPQSAEEFAHFFVLGRELRNLHLMQDESLETVDTTYPVAGDNVVEKVTYVPDATASVDTPTGSVYINESQYFGNAPLAAWQHYIGGYQPAQKWLKDRRGRTLTSDDIMHYQKIIKVLTEAQKLTQMLDDTHYHTHN